MNSNVLRKVVRDLNRSVRYGFAPVTRTDAGNAINTQKDYSSASKTAGIYQQGELVVKTMVLNYKDRTYHEVRGDSKPDTLSEKINEQ